MQINTTWCTMVSHRGYECDFVDTIPDSLSCSVCLLPLLDPHLLDCCGVKMCSPCVANNAPYVLAVFFSPSVSRAVMIVSQVNGTFCSFFHCSNIIHYRVELDYWTVSPMCLV